MVSNGLSNWNTGIQKAKLVRAKVDQNGAVNKLMLCVRHSTWKFASPTTTGTLVAWDMDT